MRNFTWKLNPLLLPALLLMAALMSCQPGNSLNPDTPQTTSSDTGRTALIRILQQPDQLLPTDTGLVRLSVVDSADTSKPLKGARLSLSSTQFIVLSAASPTVLASDSIPDNGLVNFRIFSGTAGTASVIARVTSGGRTRSIAITVSVTEKPVPPTINQDFPKQLTVKDSTALSFTVVDSAQQKALANAVVSLSSDVFTILRAASADTFSVDTTGSDGKVSLRLLAAASPPDHGFLQVRVKTAAGVSRTLTFTFSVPADQGAERPRQMVFTALRSTLRADGTDSTELRVLIKDDNNNPMPGEKIHFTATGGVVRAEAVTDDWGKASTILISERVNKTVVVTATLDRTGATAQQIVAFDGVTVAVNPDKRVVTTGAVDPVVFELRDGAQLPMSGDSLEIVVSGALNGFAQSGKDSMVVVTDTRGQYSTNVTADHETDVLITARALGAKRVDTVTFTSRTLSIAAAKPFLIGDGSDSTTVTATLKDGSGNNMDGRELRWTTSFGNFTTRPFTVTAGGQSSIHLRAPQGSGVATVNVEAYDKGSGDARTLVASGSINIPVKALKVNRLQFKVTPDNIPVKIGEAQLIATAYDSADNLMNGVLIGFRLIKGAGGGDEIILPPVDYTQSGAAQALLKAGGVISLYRGVKLAAVALDISGTDTLVIASSDTVGLTISGPPAHVSVGVNILKGENPNDGTFALPTAAVVTDVNGNLVADGTPVNFSTTPVAAHYLYFGWHETDTPPYYALGDTLYADLPWTDYNDNAKLDQGEAPSAFNATRPARGEDKDGNGVINFAPETFIDINHNGVWDSVNAEPQFYVLKSDSGSKVDTILTFVDFNADGKRETMEPFYRNGQLVTDMSQGPCKCTGQYDANGNLYEDTYFGSLANHPFPGEVAVGIDRQVATASGKALTKIVYVQTLATHATMRITAEANGFRSSVDVWLPIVHD